ncbi:hypothetical protein PSN01_03099 [Micromonospora saelicesensis]|nr:hypothetical protein PSN01_03099 [Micromonospora saelicesensis]
MDRLLPSGCISRALGPQAVDQGYDRPSEYGVAVLSISPPSRG